MQLDPPLSPNLTASTDANGLPQLPRSPLAYARAAPQFARALDSATQQVRAGVSASGALAPESAVASWSTRVRAGQTLSGIVREQMAARGVQISASDAARLAQTVARSNNLSNADVIHPGQFLNLEGLNLSLNQALASKQSITAAAQWAQSKAAAQNKTTVTASTQVQMLARTDKTSNPVLDKTLDRAVEKGFISNEERASVYNKIVQLSVKHRFSPDDFARLTLMESDGMNPKATNSRCHGIIQFCDGPDRGAATAGFASNPKAILGHSVLQQLDMVDKYFEETGLRNYGPAGLDDLYLTVLTPAARNETRPNAALNIPGPQAAYLHVNRDTTAPITRNSILAGLHFNANERLRSAGVEVAVKPTPRINASRLSAYAEQASETQIR
ncbi:MAG: hypothetical protein RLZZ24_551 [Pseudomonadota bacterium]